MSLLLELLTVTVIWILGLVFISLPIVIIGCVLAIVFWEKEVANE